MDRENFVGVVLSMTMEGEEPVDYVLDTFMGEGNTGIVFGIAPLSDPKTKKWVLKFYKPDARFEMSVLHHSFRIAENLYPNHPLLMAPDVRMRRLTEEMLGRIESDGSLFRLGVFRDMLHIAIEILGHQFQERFRAGTLPSDWLNELDGPLSLMIDDGLVLEIESYLDEERFVDDAQSFFENCLEDIRTAIANAKQEGYFHPFSRNRLFKLLGLNLENFINWDELMKITDSEGFRAALSSNEVEDFSEVVSILHYRASAKKEELDTSSEDNRSMARAEYEEIFEAAIAAARYLDAVAIKYHSDQPHFSAYAKNWHALSLLLEKRKDEAIGLLQDVLTLSITEDSKPERHNALIELARVLADSEPERARAYEREALEIRTAIENQP